MTELMLEHLCNALCEHDSKGDNFAWIKVQGEEDWEGAIFDVDRGMVFLVRVLVAKLEPVGTEEAN